MTYNFESFAITNLRFSQAHKERSCSVQNIEQAVGPGRPHHDCPKGKLGFVKRAKGASHRVQVGIVYNSS